jgi:hypothetical protein
MLDWSCNCDWEEGTECLMHGGREIFGNENFLHCEGHGKVLTKGNFREQVSLINYLGTNLERQKT